jgi:pilus assembly protein CpaB
MERRRVLLVAAVLVAALGTGLVLVYAHGADARAADRFDTVDVLVAVAPIDAGETVGDADAAGKLAVRPVSRDALLDGHEADPAALADQVALVPIYPGEQVIAAKLGSAAEAAAPLPIPVGQMAVSVNLTDAARVSGFLAPGAQVAVFLNGTDETGGRPFTRLLLPRVTVLGVGSAAPESAAPADDQQDPDVPDQLPPTLLTVAVDQRDAQKMLFASANGELAFALLDGDSTIEPGRAVTAQNLFR